MRSLSCVLPSVVTVGSHTDAPSSLFDFSTFTTSRGVAIGVAASMIVHLVLPLRYILALEVLLAFAFFTTPFQSTHACMLV